MTTPYREEPKQEADLKLTEKQQMEVLAAELNPEWKAFSVPLLNYHIEDYHALGQALNQEFPHVRIVIDMFRENPILRIEATAELAYKMDLGKGRANWPSSDEVKGFVKGYGRASLFFARKARG